MSALWDEKLEGMDTAEVHWGAGTILAIFFASSLVSAVFFGLGYSLGRGGTAKPVFGMMQSHTNTSVGVVEHATAPALMASVSSGRPLTVSGKAMGSTAHTVTATAFRQKEIAHVEPAILRPEPIVARKPATVVPEKVSKPIAAAHVKQAGATGMPHYMVQVGAIGDHKDAQTLVSLLRRKGFHAGIYPAKHDKFLHVQIGPFATEAQAQTVRHRVVTSGFHAILKRSS